MKKVLSLLLCFVMLLSLAACANSPDVDQTTGESNVDLTATDADSAQLEKLYAGRVAYQGEFHDHAKTGGTSDGRKTLAEWKKTMEQKDMDFADIADHKQVLHMRLEDWDNSMFIGGSEAGTTILDANTDLSSAIHYNMLFSDPESFESVLYKWVEEFLYIPGVNDHFQYPNFTKAEMTALAKDVYDAGGMFVHVHPKKDTLTEYMVSDDPLDYYYGDGMGLEVLCGYWGGMESKSNQNGRQLWMDLLNMGKRVYATSGSDSHNESNLVSLATIYSDKKDAAAYLGYARQGDMTAGPVGIRMCVGDTATGGTTAFAGKRLVVSVGDFHSQACDPTHTYRLDIYNEEGLVGSQELKGTETAYFALDAQDCKYYRAEVYDVTDGRIIALGNPIWNG